MSRLFRWAHAPPRPAFEGPWALWAPVNFTDFDQNHAIFEEISGKSRENGPILPEGPLAPVKISLARRAWRHLSQNFLPTLSYKIFVFKMSVYARTDPQ